MVTLTGTLALPQTSRVSNGSVNDALASLRDSSPFSFTLISFRIFVFNLFPESLRIPERVRRPPAAREALGFSPLVKASWAVASRLECVQIIAPRAEPFVFFPRRPAAQRAADSRRFRFT